MPMSFPGSFALPARLASFYFAYFAYVAAFVAYFPVYLAWEGLDAGEIAFVLALRSSRAFSRPDCGAGSRTIGAPRRRAPRGAS